MMGLDCFPDWLKRRNNQKYGPGFEDAIPYPVFQTPPVAVAADNPNANSVGIGDSFFSSYTNVVATANIGGTIFEVMPNNAYDTIDITALDLGKTSAVPIFLSFQKPGRITTKIPDGLEVNICTANAFAATVALFDPSSMPCAVGSGQPSPVFYSCLHYVTMRTNKPFYVWFGDGLQTAPNPGAGIKLQWLTVGR